MLAFDRKNGQQLWKQIVLRAPLERKSRNTFALSTPVTDGKLVYVTFLLNVSNLVLLAAYDFHGIQVWHVEPGFFQRARVYHTPALYENKVIVACQSKAENLIGSLDVGRWWVTPFGKQNWKILPKVTVRRSFVRWPGALHKSSFGNSAIASYDPRNGAGFGSTRPNPQTLSSPRSIMKRMDSF